MSLVEGVGDEVVICLCVVILVALVLVAWFSTHVQPMWNNNNSVWLVQMQAWPHNRILQMFHVDEAVADRLTNDPNTRTVRIDASIDGDELDSSLDSASFVSSRVESSSLSQNIGTSAGGASTGDSAVRERASETETRKDAKDDDERQETRTEERRVEAGDTQIRLKFLDETSKLVETVLSKTVGEFKRQHFGSEVTDGKVIRLIYRGQLLRDDTRSLESYGLHDNCIVHCHVSNTPLEAQGDRSDYSASPGLLRQRHSRSHRPDLGNQAAGRQGAGNRPVHGVELGRYFHVIFALVFVGIWGLYVTYPQYFDFASFFALVLITVIYFLTIVMSRRRADRERRHAAGLPPRQPMPYY